LNFQLQDIYQPGQQYCKFVHKISRRHFSLSLSSP